MKEHPNELGHYAGSIANNKERNERLILYVFCYLVKKDERKGEQGENPTTVNAQ